MVTELRVDEAMAYIPPVLYVGRSAVKDSRGRNPVLHVRPPQRC